MKIPVRLMYIAVLTTSLLPVNPRALELSFGGRFGLNIASIIGDTTLGVTPKLGLTGGLFATIWLNNVFFVQPELGLGLKGETAIKDEAVSNPDFATTLSYFEIPVLCGWKFLGNDQYQTSIFVGVTPAFNLSAESVYGGGSIDMKDQTQSFDVGLTGGATVCLKRGKAFIPVDVRYTYGALRFDKTSNSPLNNSVVSITVGFGSEIHLKKEESF
jgi:Outer membrane protein beta-barrel domain